MEKPVQKQVVKVQAGQQELTGGSAMTPEQQSQAQAQEPKKRMLPTIRDDVEIYDIDETASGKESWIVFDPISDSYFRIDRKHFEIIKRFYPGQDLDSLIAELKEINVDVTEMELGKIVEFLNGSNLLNPTPGKTEKELKVKSERMRKAFIKSLTKRYMFFRIPLVDPDNFLNKTEGIARFFFNKIVLSFMCIVSMIGVALLIPHFSQLKTMVVRSMSWGGMIRFTIALTIIKVFHEFGHAYAAKLSGVRVRRMGIFFMVFLPRLYTDVTDSWKIGKKRRRIFISSAGIMTELIIAGLAAYVWLNSAPNKLMSIIAFNIFAVSVLNTILVNANPLMRYDGYYVLMDFIGIDNLQQTGFAHSKAFLRKLFWGLPFNVDRGFSKIKTIFLIIFGISCSLYKVSIYTGIVMIIYFKFTKILAVILIVLEIYGFLILPIKEEIKFLKMRKKLIKPAYATGTALFACVMIALFVVPLPWSTTLPCELKSKDHYVVYIQNDGYLKEFPIQDGQKVAKGNLILRQENPFIQNKVIHNDLEYKRLMMELEMLKVDGQTLAEVPVKMVSVVNLKGILSEFKRRAGLLTIQSPIDGVFALFDDRHKQDKWLKRGEPIGEIFNPEELVIRAFAKEDEIKQFTLGDEVEVSLKGDADTHSGTIINLDNISVENMGYSGLLSVYGGPINVLKKRTGMHFVDPYFLIEIELDKEYPNKLGVGRTGLVEARYYKSIASMVYQKLIITFQNEFSF